MENLSYECTDSLIPPWHTNRAIPKRIVCLTEETVETLYLLNRDNLVVGISCFVERPQVAKKTIPIVTTFTHANIEKIIALKPDLVIGFSDIQKEIAKELIAQGLEVWITNQRSLAEVLDNIYRLGTIVGARDEADKLIQKYLGKIQTARQFAMQFKTRPRLYIEEWDEPLICGIHWFSELASICGFTDVFSQKSLNGKLAKERFLENQDIIRVNPEVIFACWCGKKVIIEHIKMRDNYKTTEAVKNDLIFELDPSVFLQPGPALFEEGIDQLCQLRRIVAEKLGY